MPSTPKKVKRRPQDNYSTPQWCIRILLNYLLFKNEYTYRHIIEPCAGNGNISQVLQQKFDSQWHRLLELTQYEIRPETKDNLENYGTIKICDYLKETLPDRANYIITNPPFSLAKEFVEKSHEVKAAIIYMLLPLSFLGSSGRYNFFKEYKPTGIYILSERPSFTDNGKTDSSVYGWIKWRGKEVGIHHLGVPKGEGRSSIIWTK